MVFELSKLPYEEKALVPYISEKTIQFHYKKHHAGYINTLNELIKGTNLETHSLEEIIKVTEKYPSQKSIYNNASQAWNHTFYWHSLSPVGGGEIPPGDFKDAVIRDFGSVDNLKIELKKAALSQFGSGWTWLIVEKGRLKVISTSNAQSPLGKERILLTIDVWEHAYYLDYQNKRADYIQTILDHLINWNFAIENFSRS